MKHPAMNVVPMVILFYLTSLFSEPGMAMYIGNVSLRSISPANHSLHVSPTTTIRAIFSGPVLRSSINSATSFLVTGWTSGRHGGTFSYSNGDSVVTFTPSAPFLKGEMVTVDIAAGVKDAGNHSLSPCVSTFTVANDRSPGTFAAKVDYVVGTEPFSTFISDVDNDGDGDIITANYSVNTVSVLKNNGDGTFAPKVDYGTGTNPVSVFIGDVDGDGFGDIVTGNGAGMVSVLVNNGNGTFAMKTDYTIGTTPGSVFVSDINGDGFGDIIIANTMGNSVTILKNNGGEGFTKSDYPIRHYPLSVFVSDINGDGYGDIITANGGDSTVSLIKNNGDGTFAARVDYTAGPVPDAVFISDIDGDGFGDIVSANRNANTVSVLKNNRNGGFSVKVDYSTGIGPFSVFVSDIDGDGDGDIITANAGDSSISVLKNIGNGTFAAKLNYPAGNYCSAVFVSDLNGDGFGDIIAANRSANTVSVLKGKNFTWTITATSGPNGSIIPSGSVSVNNGGSQVFSITPATGYHSNGLFIDSASVLVKSSYTFTNVVANHTIRATFAINQFTITASAGAGGSISPSGLVAVNYGASQAFNFIPSTGNHVDSLYVDGVSHTVATSHTFTNVTANHTIRVTFTATCPAITISPSSLLDGRLGVAYSQSITASGGAARYIYAVVTGTLPPGLTLSVGASLSGTPTTCGVYTFTVGVTDANGCTGSRAYTLTIPCEHSIRVYAGANGAIDPNDNVTVAYGANQRFTFTPNACCHVDSILIDGDVNRDSTTGYTFFNVTSDHALYVYFKINTYILTIAAANGSVTRDPDKTPYNCRDTVRLTAVPSTGYHFVNWSGSASGTANPLTVTVNAAMNITAAFAINTYTITARAGTNGSITPSGSATVNYGGSQGYTITPFTGYHIDSLFIDAGRVLVRPTYTFTNVAANHTIRATFAINTYTITSTCGANGTISPAGEKTVTYGGSQSYAFTPNTGYHVDSVLIDTVNQGAAPGYTFTNVTAGHIIRAVFAVNTFTITPLIIGSGSIAPADPTSVDYGGSRQFTYSPAAGYHFDSVVIDGVGSTDSATEYTFNNVTANQSITVYFKINTYTLTIAAVNGSVTRNPDRPLYNYGETVTLTAVPSIGYHFVNWSGSVSKTTNPLVITMNANMSITANFAINTFIITATYGTHGSISPYGSVPVNYWESRTFSITPDTGYHIDVLTVDGANVGAQSSYTFTNVTANHTIRATFAINMYTITAAGGANGTISPTGAISIAYGGSQKFTITPNVCYHIDNVIVDGADRGAVSSYTFTNVTANHAIAVSFKINTDALTVTSVNGSVTKNPDRNVYNCGDVVSLTAIPSTGCHFVNWTGSIPGGNATDNPLSLTMDTNKVVVANFVRDTAVSLQIILTWDTKSDLDLFLFVRDSLNRADTIYWRKPKSGGIRRLDVDDRDGYGPEKITLAIPFPASLCDGAATVKVHYFGPRTGKKTSARVAVYRGNSLMKRFISPGTLLPFGASSQARNVWTLPHINLCNGTFIDTVSTIARETLVKSTKQTTVSVK